MGSKFLEYKDVKPAILIKSYLDIITGGGVFEVRIPKTKYGTVSGYFDDTAIAAALIAKENGKWPALYVTANPIDPALLARNHNKLEFGSQTTTTDAEVTARRWFLVDLDPVRVPGISSTDKELSWAVERGEDIQQWLTSLGWPLPMVVNSGNGVHLMYRVDAPNDEPTRATFEFATKMLAAIFSDDKINVDTSVWNASRIWKIAGTIAAKGSDTEDRPHRVAKILKLPELLPVESGLLENLAQAMKNSKADEFKDMTGEFIGDMEKWLSDRGQTVTVGPKPLYGTEGKKWVISRCPFNNNHVGPIVGLVNNRPIYRCLHNSCSAFRWKEFREKIDPSYKDPDTIYQRLKEWCEGDSDGADQELLESACRTGKKLDGILKRLRKEGTPRARMAVLEDLLKTKRREFIKETLGENNEKGNLVGIINRTRKMQEEGIVPMYWISDYDFRIRVGTPGDLGSEKLAAEHEIALMIKFHSLGDSWVKQVHAGQAITHLAQEYRVNPLRLHLKSLKWDGTKRLDTWLIDFMGTKDSIYTRAIGRKWLISAVARGMDPGCQADHMLILEGAQGIGKSRALRCLGGPFYTEHSKSMTGINGQRDLVHVIIGKMIVEMSELATIKKADMESLKSMITTTVDDVRLSYERDARGYPRTCVFAGTTNEVGQAYIADVSGARRFWPCVCGEVGPVRSNALAEIRDQLWAEAVDAYELGEDWWTVPLEETAFEQADRQITTEIADPWYLKIRQAMTSPDSYENQVFIIGKEYESGAPTGGFTIRAGAIHIILGIAIGLDVERQDAASANRVKNIFRAIGFKKIRPQGGWFDSSYAYELKKTAAPHLWPVIRAAATKQVQELFTSE